MFDPILADIRFGCGLSPVVAAPGSVEEMLTRLAGADAIAAQFPIEPYAVFNERLIEQRANVRASRKAQTEDEKKAADKVRRRGKAAARLAQAEWIGVHVLRRTWTPDPFRERLAAFWGDHFTAQGKVGILKRGTSPYVEEAIRPHMMGSFADLVVAVTTSPLMIHYLDQSSSIGPNSERGLAKARDGGKPSGLNENLAREVLELHTLGVGAPYSQDDVRQLAELFTGMIYQPKEGVFFLETWAEPGAEEVLGVSYGGAGAATIADIHAALGDLARHPSTARHIARKLAVHFVSDTPDPALIDHVADRFLRTQGDLPQVYAALLEHPASWGRTLENVKLPFEFVASTARALAVTPDRFKGLNEKDLEDVLRGPLTRMGQPWEAPPGPDGWPEEDAAWISPQGLAARIAWAMRVPALWVDDLPDPRAFVLTALGPNPDPAARFAAQAAEAKHEGVGLVLSSPAFQRK